VSKAPLLGRLLGLGEAGTGKHDEDRDKRTESM
jgi:hypothetical protein